MPSFHSALITGDGSTKRRLPSREVDSLCADGTICADIRDSFTRRANGPTMDVTEKRQNPRRGIEHTVFMATGVGTPQRCEMRDVSESGARLRVNDGRTAPQEFLVVLGMGLNRWCRVMWRSEAEIGIKFIEPPASLKAGK